MNISSLESERNIFESTVRSIKTPDGVQTMTEIFSLRVGWRLRGNKPGLFRLPCQIDLAVLGFISLKMVLYLHSVSSEASVPLPLHFFSSFLNMFRIFSFLFSISLRTCGSFPSLILAKGPLSTSRQFKGPYRRSYSLNLSFMAGWILDCLWGTVEWVLRCMLSKLSTGVILDSGLVISLRSDLEKTLLFSAGTLTNPPLLAMRCT